MEQVVKSSQPNHQQDMLFNSQDKHGFYKTVFNRRDVRGQFKPDPIPDAVLSRVLYAAHHAPSVGFMQPWNFMLIRDNDKKQRIHDLFDIAHNEAAAMFPKEQRETYRSLKLEGIMESPLNICITCNRDSAGPTVIGRTHIEVMDQYSSVCAVQNLWLAARAEGLGVGWVSILDQQKLQELLAIPRKIIPIAYLCIGYVEHFYNKPELQTAGWLPRQPLSDLICFDGWQNTRTAEQDALIAQINQDRDFPKKF
ncbi:MAG: 5,6-dimethylbenzimidazole synthase [Oceanospirillaceae bacterium]